LPYLVSNVTEILDIEPEEEDGEGMGVDEDAAKKGKAVVIKTTSR
jgi:hypothetical protein